MKGTIARSLIVFVVCLMLLLATGTQALAAGATIKLSRKTGPPTTNVTVNGNGFGASEQVTITFDTTVVGSATTSSSGAFSAQIVVPKSALPGTHTVQATGQTSGLSASASFLVQTNWSMFGSNPQHTHVNPFENVVSPSNVSGLVADWNDPNGYTINSPAVFNGVVYDHGKDIRAYDQHTGALLWNTSIGSQNSASSPAVAVEMINGVNTAVVYVGSDDHNVYALNATTGAILWNHTTGGTINSSPVVSNGMVYVGSEDGFVYALNAVTGTLVWTFLVNFPVESSPAVATVQISGVNTTVVYVGAFSNDLYALDANTGSELWAYDTGALIGSSPAFANVQINGTLTPVVYVGAYDGQVYAFNAVSGLLLWNFSTPNQIRSSPAVYHGIVYIGSDDGNVYALKAPTGARLWSFNTLNSLNGVSPAVANGVVYIASGNSNVYALNANTGAQLWSTTAGCQSNGSPAVANGVVYFGQECGIYAFHLPGTNP